MSDTKFQVGDRVRIEGTVRDLSTECCCVYIPGGPETWVPRRCLTLIERPKRKVKKTATRWVNVYPGDAVSVLRDSEEECLTNKDVRCIATVPVEICWEEEE